MFWPTSHRGSRGAVPCKNHVKISRSKPHAPALFWLSWLILRSYRIFVPVANPLQNCCRNRFGAVRRQPPIVSLRLIGTLLPQCCRYFCFFVCQRMRHSSVSFVIWQGRWFPHPRDHINVPILRGVKHDVNLFFAICSMSFNVGQSYTSPETSF